MKFSKIRSVAAAIFLLLPCAAHTAEEPEAVYAKFHRAVAARDLEEMLRYGPEARRAEMAAMSAAQKEASLKMLGMLMPRAYLLRSKTVNPSGRSALLVLSGPGATEFGGRAETLYGTIKMVMERGEWKVDEASWSTEKPLIAAPERPASSPPGQKAAASAVPSRKAPGAPVVGSMSSAPERKLGAAKEPCVYKPVMTNEDMERCR